MDSKAIGVIGALTALAALDAAQAGSPVATARSFAELLDPIPNAVTRLAEDNATRDAERTAVKSEDEDYRGPMSRAGNWRPRPKPAATPPMPSQAPSETETSAAAQAPTTPDQASPETGASGDKS